MRNWIVGLFTAAAEGRFGDGPKKAYWLVHGWAPWVGLVFGVADIVLSSLPASTCPSCASWDSTVRLVWESAVLAGLATGAHNAEPPKVEGQ